MADQIFAQAMRHGDINRLEVWIGELVFGYDWVGDRPFRDVPEVLNALAALIRQHAAARD